MRWPWRKKEKYITIPQASDSPRIDAAFLARAYHDAWRILSNAGCRVYSNTRCINDPVYQFLDHASNYVLEEKQRYDNAAHNTLYKHRGAIVRMMEE